MAKLFLLLWKDLLGCLHRPFITVLTVLLPLALILLVTYGLTASCANVRESNSSMTQKNYFTYAFTVDGAQRDFSKQLNGLGETIEEAYCSKIRTIQLGYFFSDDVDQAAVASIIQDLSRRHRGVLFTRYDGYDDLEKALVQDATDNTECIEGMFWGGIAFTKLDLADFELRYEIWMTAPRKQNTRWYVGTEDWKDKVVRAVENDAMGSVKGEVDYWTSGFLSLQYAVDSTFIERAGRGGVGNNISNISITLERLPEPSEYASGWLSTFPFIFGLWLLTSFFLVSDTARRIAAEKRSGMAGFLSLMGLPSSTFYISHAVFAFMKVLIVFLPGVVILGYQLLDDMAMTLILLSSLIFFVCITCYGLLISAVLHAPSLATYLTGFVWLGLIYLSYSEYTFWKLFGYPNVTLFEILWSWDFIYIYYKMFRTMFGGMFRARYFGWTNFVDGKMGTYLYAIGLGLLLLHCAIAILLTAYFDNVYPYGDLPRKHPLFFLGIGREKPETDDEKSKRSKTSKTSETNENVQPESELKDPEEVDIEVRNLVKKFGSFRAVNGLSFRARKGRVTALLGHNGAGKSTTFAILCGLSRPTSGSVRICGVQLDRSTAAECQSHIGYCPQYDPVFDDFTVKEHLEFFRLLCENSDPRGEDKVLDWLDLTESAKVTAKKLSGGIRRRLTVAIAIVSGRRILLFDEPTAGLDPGMRQRVNSFIEQLKEKRTVLLTTHYMSEADSLGDRINIMVAGKLACAGTSEFLKKRFGAGYLLTVASKEKSTLSGEQLLKFVRTYVDDATLENATLHQFIVLLPDGKKAKFASLFAELEAQSGRLGIDSFGISLNSLEQIFFKVGKDSHGDDRDDDDEESAKAKDFADGACTFGEKPPKSLWIPQLRALLCKRLLCMLKRWYRLILQVVFPILLMALIGGQKEMAVPGAITLSAGRLSPSLVFLQSTGQESPLYDSINAVLKGAGKYKIELVDESVDIRDAILDSPKTLFEFGLAFVVDSQPSGTSVRAFFSGVSTHGSSVALSVITNALVGDSSNTIVTSLHPYYSADAGNVEKAQQAASQSEFLPYLNCLAFALIFAGFVMLPVEERTSRFLDLQLTTGLNPLFYWLSMVIIDLSIFVLVCTGMMIMFLARSALPGIKLPMLLLWPLVFFSSTPFAYCFSLLFDHPSTASMMVIVIYLVACIVSFVLPFLRQFSSGFADFIHGLLRPLCLLLASGCFFWLCLTLRYSLRSRTCAYSTWKAIRSCLVCCCCCCCRCCCRKKNGNETQESKLNDDDVKQERARVDKLGHEDAAVCLRDLNKFYGGNHAVRDLTFAMDYKECLGLLGVNGVGKTSMFHMLTRITIPDSGEASCGGVSITQRMPVCFCPQYNAMLGYLSGRSVLNLMAGLRGYDDSEERVQCILEAVSLVPHASKAVSELSGGQKRRLSVAAALIVGSREVLLDEPTAGIDPQARREVWALLSSIREQKVAILLSSHSMDECEALCSRIAVMNEGTLVAIGTTQHIRSKYGKGYILTVTIANVSNMDDCVKAVAEKFPAAKLKTDHPSVQLEWDLDKADNERLSILFANIHDFCSARPEVTDYSLTQKSLEAAFLKLAQQSDESIV